mgnify:CR=1 FL=1
MILPLRRRHRWMVPALFVFLAIAAVLALRHPAPSVRTGHLPAALVGDQEPAR